MMRVPILCLFCFIFGLQLQSGVAQMSSLWSANSLTYQQLLLKDSTARKAKGIRVGLSMNYWNYIGDFTDNKYDWTRIYPGFNLSLQPVSRKKLQTQFNMGIGSVADQADAAKITTTSPDIVPNQFFQTTFVYGDIRLKYSFLPQKRIKPYMGAGVGALIFMPQDGRNRSLSEPDNGSRPTGEEYSIFTVQAPLCAGVDWRFHPILSVGLQYNFVLTGTDYLDNIGSLGSKSGKDKLQSLQLTLYITPNPPLEEMKRNKTLVKPPMPKPVQPKVVVPTPKSQPKDSSQTIFEIEPETQPPVNEQDLQEYQNLLNKGNDWIHQIIKGAMNESVEAETPETLAEKEALAIKQERFIYYEAKAGQRLSDIANQYKVRKETIIQLNKLEISPNQDLLLKPANLKIPDILTQ